MKGENGSGMSCMMQIVSGYHQPDRGCMEIDGKRISFTSRRELIFNTVIYIQQNANVLENLTVTENIYYNQMPYKNKCLGVIDLNLLEKLCSDIINDLELPFDLNDSVDNLGMAQKQILGFCRAYVSNAKVVILDEPTRSLDISSRIDIL